MCYVGAVCNTPLQLICRNKYRLLFAYYHLVYGSFVNEEL